MVDATGEYYSYEEVGPNTIYVADDNTKVVSGVLCSIQDAVMDPIPSW